MWSDTALARLAMKMDDNIMRARRIASTRLIRSIFRPTSTRRPAGRRKNRGDRRGRQLRRRATVLGLGSVRADHLAGLVDAVFGHSVMEDRAETEIPSRLDSWCPGRSQLIEKALEAQILGQLIERLVLWRELQ